MEMEYSKKGHDQVTKEVKSPLPEGWHMTQVRSMVCLRPRRKTGLNMSTKKTAIKFANK